MVNWNGKKWESINRTEMPTLELQCGCFGKFQTTLMILRFVYVYMLMSGIEGASSFSIQSIQANRIRIQVHFKWKINRKQPKPFTHCQYFNLNLFVIIFLTIFLFPVCVICFDLDFISVVFFLRVHVQYRFYACVISAEKN